MRGRPRATPRQEADEVLFLETTIQAERATQHPVVREELEQFLSGYRLVTSTYVLGEFKSTFLLDATVLYNLLVSSADIGIARRRFERYQDRKHKRLERLFTLVTEDGDMRKEAILPKVERLITDELMRSFQQKITDVSDITGCARAKAIPERRDVAYHLDVSCRQDPKPSCAVSAYFAAHPEMLKIVLQSLSGGDHETQRRREAIEAVLSGTKEPHGNVCRSISDAIIATEVPYGATLATTNVKHLRPLVRILGVGEVINPLVDKS